MLNDYFKTILYTLLVMIGIFAFFSPINNLPELFRMALPESYHQYSFAQLLLKQFWNLTVVVIIIGTFVYALFVRN